MLRALTIRDFAVIDQLELNFESGFTVLTGETGAGKSVIINATVLALGGRASMDVIRAGADSAQIEALFEINTCPDVIKRLHDAGLSAGDQLVIRRIISRSGRSRVYINGAMATVNTLAHVTEGLVDISGQHAHYSLLKTDTHLDILDRVGHLETLTAKFTDAYGGVIALDARIAELRNQRLERAEREDFLRFQLQELHEAGLTDADEEAHLENEGSRLRNAEKLRDAAATAEHILYDKDGAAAELVGRAVREVETLIALDPSLEPVLEDLNSTLVLIEESARTVGDYARNLDSEPQRLEEIDNRLGVFARLRRKYGATLAEVIQRMHFLEDELTELSNSDNTLETLLGERAEAVTRLRAMADSLSAARKRAASELAQAIVTELKDLAMPDAQLTVEVRPLVSGLDIDGRSIGPRGADRIEFMLSANLGTPPQSLSRIASGGELSRFMLAVKRVIAHRDPVATYIFDEVDTGVGGSTAEAIGQCLKRVGTDRQSICITHLPQIAALGTQHLRVMKRVDEGRTVSTITAITAEERVEEIARMLGGATITEATRKNAREMITRGTAQSD